MQCQSFLKGLLPRQKTPDRTQGSGRTSLGTIGLTVLVEQEETLTMRLHKQTRKLMHFQQKCLRTSNSFSRFENQIRNR
eukprot:4179813-Amphidinium_carterae.1